MIRAMNVLPLYAFNSVGLEQRHTLERLAFKMHRGYLHT